MDTAALATSILAMQAGKLQMAVAARLLKMNADMESSTVQTLLGHAQDSASSVANVAAGIGGNLDISA